MPGSAKQCVHLLREGCQYLFHFVDVGNDSAIQPSASLFQVIKQSAGDNGIEIGELEVFTQECFQILRLVDTITRQHIDIGELSVAVSYRARRKKQEFDSACGVVIEPPYHFKQDNLRACQHTVVPHEQ